MAVVFCPSSGGLFLGAVDSPTRPLPFSVLPLYSLYEEVRSHGQDHTGQLGKETRRHEGQDSRASRGPHLCRLARRPCPSVIISRSLASQYLNDLVRAGLVVKVAGRPVRYFHRRAFQKRFQVKLSASEYASLADLIQATGIADHRDFARAVGFDMSLSSVVEQCKAAVQYPPFGLPILLSGGVGVGKSFLSRLVYEYGKNQGLLSRDSSYVRIDCAGVPDAASFNGLLDESIAKARGGVVFVNGIEALSPSAMEHCLASALGLDASQDAPRARLVLSTMT